jgi:hypothetical protein
MGGVFKKPKAPPPPKPPKPIEMPQTPVVDQVQIDRDRGDMLKRRRGRAATVLTNPAIGAVDDGSVATKNLLGM